MQRIFWDEMLLPGYSDLRQMLIDLYDGLPGKQELADKLGVSKRTIETKLRELGIPSKPRGGKRQAGTKQFVRNLLNS